jgi:hypothetical protein
VKRPVFQCCATMSDGEEVHSPELGPCSLQHLPPELDSKSDLPDNETPKKKQNHKRLCIPWQHVLCFLKGDEATMGEDEMKLLITQAYNKIMEDVRMFS